MLQEKGVVWIITEVASIDFSPQPSRRGIKERLVMYGENSIIVTQSSNLISSEAAPESVITLSIELS